MTLKYSNRNEGDKGETEKDVRLVVWSASGIDEKGH